MSFVIEENGSESVAFAGNVLTFNGVDYDVISGPVPPFGGALLIDGFFQSEDREFFALVLDETGASTVVAARRLGVENGERFEAIVPRA